MTKVQAEELVRQLKRSGREAYTETVARHSNGHAVRTEGELVTEVEQGGRLVDEIRQGAGA